MGVEAKRLGKDLILLSIHAFRWKELASLLFAVAFAGKLLVACTTPSTKYEVDRSVIFDLSHTTKQQKPCRMARNNIPTSSTKKS